MLYGIIVYSLIKAIKYIILYFVSSFKFLLQIKVCNVVIHLVAG